MSDELDHVWKALSDPTRRTILDLLRTRAMMTTEIVNAFPNMTRFAIMKHIDALRNAGLINTREEGRRRINSLNVVPIRQIYERWVGPFSELWSSTLLRIKDDAEKAIKIKEKSNATRNTKGKTVGYDPRGNGSGSRDHKPAI